MIASIKHTSFFCRSINGDEKKVYFIVDPHEALNIESTLISIQLKLVMSAENSGWRGLKSKLIDFPSINLTVLRKKQSRLPPGLEAMQLNK